VGADAVTKLHVSDTAILRYLQRAHGLDIEAVRQHIAGRCTTGAELGALTVVVESVKFVLVAAGADTVVTTVVKRHWPVTPRRISK
jgi:hypothetical protein